MQIRYRVNCAIQLGIGAIVFATILLLPFFDERSLFSWAGALAIAIAAFLIAGYRIRKMPETIYILVGHPDPDTDRLCHKLADAYEDGAGERGFSVRRTNISDLSFDPILHNGYEEVQELEPDLQTVQENITWADHVVIFYPNWWSSMPAQLKGLFDRAWLPGFAFDFYTYGWRKRLKGRTGRVVVTLDNIPVFAYLLFGDYTNEIQNGILEFAGIQPTDVKRVGGIKFRSRKGLEREITKMYRMGRRAA